MAQNDNGFPTADEMKKLAFNCNECQYELKNIYSEIQKNAEIGFISLINPISNKYCNFIKENLENQGYTIKVCKQAADGYVNYDISWMNFKSLKNVQKSDKFPTATEMKNLAFNCKECQNELKIIYSAIQKSAQAGCTTLIYSISLKYIDLIKENLENKKYKVNNCTRVFDYLNPTTQNFHYEISWLNI